MPCWIVKLTDPKHDTEAGLNPNAVPEAPESIRPS